MREETFIDIEVVYGYGGWCPSSRGPLAVATYRARSRGFPFPKWQLLRRKPCTSCEGGLERKTGVGSKLSQKLCDSQWWLKAHKLPIHFVFVMSTSLKKYKKARQREGQTAYTLSGKTCGLPGFYRVVFRQYRFFFFFNKNAMTVRHLSSSHTSSSMLRWKYSATAETTLKRLLNSNLLIDFWIWTWRVSQYMVHWLIWDLKACNLRY